MDNPKSSNPPEHLQICKPSGTVCIDNLYIADFTIPRYGDVIRDIFLLCDQNYLQYVDLYIDSICREKIVGTDLNVFNNRLHFKNNMLANRNKYPYSTFMVRAAFLKNCIQHAKLVIIGVFLPIENPLSDHEINCSAELSFRQEQMLSSYKITYPTEFKPSHTYKKCGSLHSYTFSLPNIGALHNAIIYNATGSSAIVYGNDKAISEKYVEKDVFSFSSGERYIDLKTSCYTRFVMVITSPARLDQVYISLVYGNSNADN